MSWPVITRVNIGDDAALLRRIDVSITSFDNPMICGEIFFSKAGGSKHQQVTSRGNIDADAAL